MRTVFNFFFAICIIIIFIIIFTSKEIFPQSNIHVKPSTANRLSWQPSGEADVFRYGIFYAQGSDTTLFPFKNNTDPDSLWNNEAITNWMFTQTYNTYYYHEPANIQGVTYIRYGIAGINLAGKVGRIRTYYKVIPIKKPTILPPFKID